MNTLGIMVGICLFHLTADLLYFLLRPECLCPSFPGFFLILIFFVQILKPNVIVLVAGTLRLKPLWMGFQYLTKEPSERSVTLSPLCEDPVRSPRPRRRPTPSHTGTPVSDFCLPELWEIIFCFHKHPVCAVLFAAQTNMLPILCTM